MTQRFYGGQNLNDFSEWTAEDTSATKKFLLSAGSALGGTAYGISVDPGGSPTHKEVTYNVSITSPRGIHRLACRVNKNTLVMTSFGFHDIVVLTSDGSTETRILELSFYEDSGTIKAMATVLDDNSSNIDVQDTDALPTGDVTLEAELVYASGVSANDGTLELFVNGISKASRSDVDIYLSETGAFGARVIVIADGGWSSGIYYLDEIYYRDDSTPIYPAFSGYDLVLGGGQP